MIKNHSFIHIFILSVVLSGCGGNEPQREDVPEMITKVTLTFTPVSGSPVIVTATDPDGEGIQGIKTDGTIALAKSTTYVLTISLVNTLAAPTDDAYDITMEVREEGDEHMFFFSWTGNAFDQPAGNGNIDVRSDLVDYSGAEDSKDSGGLPLGLTTTWKSAGIATSGASFRVMLKHQPQLKSLISTSTDGETDLDISFPLTVN